MTLAQFIASGQNIALDDLRNDVHLELVRECQNRLTALGILDPDTERRGEKDYGPKSDQDGRFGRNSRAALEIFCHKAQIPLTTLLTPSIATALQNANPATFFPLQLANQANDSTDTRFARRILRFMQANGYWIARHPDMITIAYVEGCNSKGDPNDDLDNQWNDRRLLIRIQANGQPQLVLNEIGATEPTIAYAKSQVRKKRRNPHEPYAARIAFGQYKAWIMGFHHRDNPRKRQPALQQVMPVLLHRDKDANGKRTPGDVMDLGVFGINQHSTRAGVEFEVPGSWSEGCLVGKWFEKHLIFLDLLKKDLRFVKNDQYRYMSIVIDGSRLKREQA
jgi:hypothetical protein